MDDKPKYILWPPVCMEEAKYISPSLLGSQTLETYLEACQGRLSTSPTKGLLDLTPEEVEILFSSNS